ncbi:MAG: MFS transporter [Nannocystaceae bacterium]|nr:MFS transporter [Nannocystaceae bacterium]
MDDPNPAAAAHAEPGSRRGLSESQILLIIGAVQFINILDFMMIAPLGPRLALAVDMPESRLADAVAAYTVAAATAGIVGSTFLDRFDRRPALLIALVGLVAGTAAGGLATSFGELVLARMLAGAFGGPATSIAIAIVSDVIPAHRRGRAMGAVMGAFAAASVLGVPAGLALAEVGDWRTPFFAVAGAGLVVAAAATRLPPLRLHFTGTRPQPTSLVRMLSRPAVLASYAMTFTVNAGAFVLLPNIATFVQNNLGLPEAQLKYLYLAGGVVSFFTTRACGKLVDRVGTFRIATAGSLGFVFVTWIGFAEPGVLPVDTHLLACMYGVFMAFMFANGVRNVAYQTLTTRVPRPEERARFMSLQSAVQHIAAAAGALLSARVLETTADHQLVGMTKVAWISIVFGLVLPLLVKNVERRLRAGARAEGG